MNEPVTKSDLELLEKNLKTEMSQLEKKLTADIQRVDIELKNVRNELKTDIHDLEQRIDTKIETTVNGAVKQILSAFDLKMDQVRNEMAFADEHHALKTRVDNLEKSVFG